MSTLKAYPRGDWSKISAAQRGTWARIKLDGKKSARLCCPYCGFVACLDQHSIADDGSVSPSVDCPVDTCCFHEFIKLGGWRG